MKFTSLHHRLIQAVLSMILLELALFTGDVLKIVTVIALLMVAWGLLLAIWLIDWANDQPPLTPEPKRQPHKKRSLLK
ncbi:MAG TPA: hypothetical protein P5526_15150 [Anaerolineae bacterium]|mgnify:CR=1 FL=1|nr:hypothetical protein [Anaerolineae bacterium]